MPELKPTYERFLRLLARGLYSAGSGGEALGMSLSERQWYKAIEEAEKHTVCGVVFDAVTRLPEDEMPPVSVLAPWLAMAAREERKFESMSDVLSRLLGIFHKAGLRPVVQKGHAIARFYPAPGLRSFGDIDLWFPDGERAAADRIIASLGIKVDATPDSGSRYSMDGTEVEHHSSLVEIHNPFKAPFLKKLYAKYPPTDIVLPGGISVSVPAPMVELLMVNAHILKHCLGVGIGLRQFCDYSLVWRKFTSAGEDGKPMVNADEYLEVCRNLGILRWTAVLHQFINTYLPAPDGNAVAIIVGFPAEEAVENLFMMVMEGGNFGHYNHGRNMKRHAGALQRKLSTMLSFLHNRSFVYRQARAEALWTFTRLLAGQIRI